MYEYYDLCKAFTLLVRIYKHNLINIIPVIYATRYIKNTQM